MAHALAKAEAKTLLFDGDLGLANLDIQLGLMPEQDLGSVIGGKLTLNQAVLNHDAYGFDIIAGLSGSGGLVNITANRLKMLGDDLKVLAAGYDQVLIDLGAGVEQDGVVAIDRQSRVHLQWAHRALEDTQYHQRFSSLRRPTSRPAAPVCGR